MDFPDLQKEYYNGIYYMISDLFTRDYNDDYTIQDNAKTKAIYSMDINFSIEVFDEDEAELLQFAFEEDITPIDAVHDNYILKRASTLDEPDISIKKEVPKTVGFPGYIQVVHGTSSYYDDAASYFTATLEIDDEYYVFQLIGIEENMGYLYDDFIDILSSVEK